MLPDTKISNIKNAILFFAFMPLVDITAVKFVYRARKDLRLPSNDMWE